MSLFRTRNLLSPRSEMLNVHFPHFLLSAFRPLHFRLLHLSSERELPRRRLPSFVKMPPTSCGDRLYTPVGMPVITRAKHQHDPWKALL